MVGLNYLHGMGLHLADLVGVSYRVGATFLCAHSAVPGLVSLTVGRHLGCLVQPGCGWVEDSWCQHYATSCCTVKLWPCRSEVYCNAGTRLQNSADWACSSAISHSHLQVMQSLCSCFKQHWRSNIQVCSISSQTQARSPCALLQSGMCGSQPVPPDDHQVDHWAGHVVELVIPTLYLTSSLRRELGTLADCSRLVLSHFPARLDSISTLVDLLLRRLVHRRQLTLTLLS